MTLPMWSNPRLHSEHTWRHADKMPILIQGFKDLKCIPRAERGEVWASVTNLVKEQRVVAEKPVEATTAKPTKRKFALLAASSESDSEHEDHSVEESVRRYRAEPTISTEACPLQWWAKYAGSHSRLSSIAQNYLVTPATSVPCERLFSLASHLYRRREFLCLF